MVDIHCHILPETDDGADSWETAAGMCRMAAADGIDHMVATPHANDRYNYDRERHAATLEKLGQMAGSAPALSLGCDFHFSYENVEDALRCPERYAIGDTRYMLIELSDYIAPRYVGDNITRLVESGLAPILTHPERNLMLQRDPTAVLDWVARGCVVQVTASSVTGFWGKRATQVTQWLLQHEAVHVLATDAHDLVRRPPVLSAAREAIAQQYGAELSGYFVEGNPQAIVEGVPLPYFPKPATR